MAFQISHQPVEALGGRGADREESGLLVLSAAGAPLPDKGTTTGKDLEMPSLLPDPPRRLLLRKGIEFRVGDVDKVDHRPHHRSAPARPQSASRDPWAKAATFGKPRRIAGRNP